MGAVGSKQTPKKIVDQAKAYQVDSTPLSKIRESISHGSSVVTYWASKGKLSSECYVYPGDSSADDPALLKNTTPLLCLEYKKKENAAVVKDGVTGDVLMMLVREQNDEGWHGGDTFRCACGARTEARLYANGRPVAVSYGKESLDVSPKLQGKGEDRVQLGASMVELIKVKQGNTLNLLLRKKDGSHGSQAGTFSKVRGTGAVLHLTAENTADPVVMVAMAWYNLNDEQ
eukprot:TRINITY_DN376_c0_g1_i1.p1 TRINITY_DN376_c0_g1~~TRINITY_DN376_c0_g1_i1.p1  ORF type:complete len:230 (-),score=47.75 TRINITY_DN376_c0_g1_i1:318-1007(-)